MRALSGTFPRCKAFFVTGGIPRHGHRNTHPPTLIGSETGHFTPLPPCVRFPTSVGVSTLQPSLPSEVLNVNVNVNAGAGMGATPRGRSSICEQPDSCSTLTH